MSSVGQTHPLKTSIVPTPHEFINPVPGEKLRHTRGRATIGPVRNAATPVPLVTLYPIVGNTHTVSLI